MHNILFPYLLNFLVFTFGITVKYWCLLVFPETHVAPCCKYKYGGL
jgi:hypothetical protein